MLNRVTLVQQLAQRLGDQIHTDKLQAGEALPSTAAIAARYNVSRPVVREALTLLEARGFIRVRNGKKPVVSAITSQPLLNFFCRVASYGEDSYRELMEVRKALEIQSAVLAAERRTQEEMKVITAIVTAMGRHLYEVEKFADLDLEFHIQIANASHNKILIYLVGSIRDAIKQGIIASTEAMLQVSRDLPKVGQKLHLAIMHELQRRDPHAAGRAMALHWEEMYALIAAAERRYKTKPKAASGPTARFQPGSPQ
jgi:GntR family transcriptional repressor for pyruvate dehydrogenase complex